MTRTRLWVRLDNVLVGTGVDGFKNDGTDPFILELDAQGGAKGHDGQPVRKWLCALCYRVLR